MELTDAHRTRWGQMASAVDLAEHSQALLEFVQPCFLLRTRSELSARLGGSRIGGVPDLPPSLSWPVDDEHHLTFVAQLDLGTFEAGWVPGLPEIGWLWFFVGVDEPAWEVPHAVLFFDGPREELSPAAPPSGTGAIHPEERDFASLEVDSEPSFAIPALTGPKVGLGEFDLEDFETSDTRVGGLPVSWAGDARQDAYLLRNGFGPILFRTHENPRTDGGDGAQALLRSYHADEDTHLLGMKRWRTLFVLASERDANMCWWDAGLLQFLIHDEALLAREFGETYCGVASS